MGKGDPFGPYGVRRRAAENTKRPARMECVTEENGDAVPMGRNAAPAKAERTPYVSQRPVKGAPYRVRERMAEESVRREKLAAARASTRKKTEERNAAGGGEADRKPVSLPVKRIRFRPHTDEIFQKETDAETKAPLRRKRTSRVWIVLSSLLLILAFSVGAGVVIYKTVYRIDTVYVEGSGRYSPEQLLLAAGVNMGDNLYSFSSRRAEERITLRYPLVANLSVARAVPGTVTFTLTEEKAVYRAVLYGEQWALSPAFRLLYPVDAVTAEREGLTLLLLPTVQSAVSGRPLVFLSEGEGQSAKELAEQIRKSSLFERVTSVDLRQPYTLKVVTDHLYLLDFGDRSDVEQKLKVASAVLKDAMFDAGMRAKIDLSVPGETSVVLDDQLDLGE